MKIAVVVGGVEHVLDQTGHAWVEEFDGVGLPPVRRLAESGPNQNGESDLGFRLQPRIIDLVLGMEVDDATLFPKRSALLQLFRPSFQGITLRFTLDDGSVRQIDGHAAGEPLTLGRRGGMGGYQSAVVALRCPDPLFYDPAARSLTFGLESGGSPLSFPRLFPTTFGASTLDRTRTLAYGGSWREFPLVFIRGPIAGPRIENLATGDKLDFAGYTIEEGNTYTVDCRYGAKQVRDAAGVNRVHELTNDSDLATFSLEANPDLPGGLNDLMVTGEGSNSVTEVFVQYLHRYIGL